MRKYLMIRVGGKVKTMFIRASDSFPGEPEYLGVALTPKQFVEYLQTYEHVFELVCWPFLNKSIDDCYPYRLMLLGVHPGRLMGSGRVN